MFSSRFHWNLQPNPLARLLETKRRAGTAILDLTESNPTRAGFNYPEQEILQALAPPASLLYEPSAFGLCSAREAVSEYYGARGRRIDPCDICLTASTSEAYTYLFKLLAEPGDEILVPRPSYPLFEYLAALESVRPASYPLRYHGAWSLDMEALAAGITERTRAVVLVHPNNPTGSFVKREELEKLVALAQPRDLAILCDEVFSDYAFGPDPARLPTLAGEQRVLTFSLSGLSKIAGLPQMKLAWIVLSGPAASKNVARERLELIADTFLSVATPVQHALPRLLVIGARVREQIQGRVRSNLSFLRSATDRNSPCTLLRAEGGWYAILKLPRTRSEEQWCLDLLEKENVLVQPGYFYDFEDEAYAVASLLTPREIFEEGIRRVLAGANL